MIGLVGCDFESDLGEEFLSCLCWVRSNFLSDQKIQTKKVALVLPLDCKVLYADKCYIWTCRTVRLHTEELYTDRDIII